MVVFIYFQNFLPEVAKGPRQLDGVDVWTLLRCKYSGSIDEKVVWQIIDLL